MRDPGSPVLPALAGTVPRARAWLRLAVVGLVALLYLTGWSVYALTRTGDDRYRAVEPGAAVTALDAEWRLLSLVQTTRLASSSGEPGVAGARAVYVVAQLERTPVRATDFARCTTALLGPAGRLWEAAGYEADLPPRDAPSCSSEDTVVGRGYRFEAVYVVPEAFVGDVLGVVLPRGAPAQRKPVLRPPT